MFEYLLLISIGFVSSVYPMGTTDSASASTSTSTVNIQSTSTTITEDTTLSRSSSTNLLNTGTETVEVGPPLIAGPATSTSVWTYTSVGTYSSSSSTPSTLSTSTSISTSASTSTTSTSIAAVVGTHSSSVQIIDVGDATNKFTPNVLNANIGDIISFRFFPANHSVVQAKYGFPCIPLSTMNTSASSFFSGFFPLASMPSNPPTWNLTVNDTEPFFFYCSAPGSCLDWQMVGGVNLNSSTDLSQHVAAITKQAIMLQPGEPWKSEDQESSIASEAGPTSATYMSSNDDGISSESASSGHGHAEALSGGVIAGIAIAGFLVLALAGVALWFMSRSHTLKQALQRERKATEEVVNSFNSPQSTQDLDLHGMLDGVRFRQSGIADHGGLRDSMRWSGLSAGLHGNPPHGLEGATFRGVGQRSPISPMTLGAVCGPGLAELEEKPDPISEIAGDEPPRQEMGGSDPENVSILKDRK